MGESPNASESCYANSQLPGFVALNSIWNNEEGGYHKYYPKYQFFLHQFCIGGEKFQSRHGFSMSVLTLRHCVEDREQSQPQQLTPSEQALDKITYSSG
jgi:hypothetical protein